MCVILACDEKLPGEKTVRAAAERNPDGGGVAWVENGKVRWEKGLPDGKAAWDVIKAVGRAPLLAHFRIATVGGKIEKLTHPFPISPGIPLDLKGQAPAVLMHNGHWNAWDTHLKTALSASKGKWPRGEWSDSRAIAWFLLTGGQGAIDFLEKHGGGLGGDRIVSLNGEGILDFWGNWYHRDGFYISNDHFETKVSIAPGYNTKHTGNSGKGSGTRAVDIIRPAGSPAARGGATEPPSPLPPPGLTDITPHYNGELSPATDAQIVEVLCEMRELKRKGRGH